MTESEEPRSKLRGIDSTESSERSKLRGIRPVASEDHMPTIGRIGALEVVVFRNDHAPPHFHVFGAEFSAKFAIADLSLLSSKGRIRRRDIKAVEEWGYRHQSALYLNWELARTGQPAQKIED